MKSRILIFWYVSIVDDVLFRTASDSVAQPVEASISGPPGLFVRNPIVFTFLPSAGTVCFRLLSYVFCSAPGTSCSSEEPQFL